MELCPAESCPAFEAVVKRFHRFNRQDAKYRPAILPGCDSLRGVRPRHRFGLNTRFPEAGQSAAHMEFAAQQNNATMAVGRIGLQEFRDGERVFARGNRSALNNDSLSRNTVANEEILHERRGVPPADNYATKVCVAPNQCGVVGTPVRADTERGRAGDLTAQDDQGITVGSPPPCAKLPGPPAQNRSGSYEDVNEAEAGGEVNEDSPQTSGCVPEEGNFQETVSGGAE
jgi:hypothetical protein